MEESRDSRLVSAAAVIRAIVLLAAALGALCVLAGSGIALYAAWLVFCLIEDPKNVSWVAALIGQGTEYLQATRGTVDGKSFDIELAREAFLMGLLFIGVLLLWAVAGLAKALISAGITLLGPAIRSGAWTPRSPS
jgi:hypothetical protein